MDINRYNFFTAIYYNSIKPEDRKASKIDTNKYPASLGVALEICAGIIDKNLPIEEIAKEEVLEECGYNVELSNLEKVIAYRYNFIRAGLFDLHTTVTLKYN